jgi:4-amino-4-deoxy-L-arabinose transferase-like glycosyltransferase
MLASLTAAVIASGSPPNLNFIPNSGFLDLLFHKTDLSLQVFGQPNPPFSINLIQLLIVLFLAFAINGATERLTGRKVSLALAVIITLVGAWIFATFVKLPFDFAIEGVRIIAAILGALIIAVFYTLIFGKGKKA